MALTILHREDQNTTDKKLQTSSLAFKSIVGQEQELFNNINGQYSNMISQLRNIQNIQTRVNNTITNINRANKLINDLYHAMYMIKDRETEYVEMIQDSKSRYEVHNPQQSYDEWRDNN